MDLVAPSINGCLNPRALALHIAIGNAMPLESRARIDALPTAEPALADWPESEVVDAILAATTVEARLYLAKAYALCCEAKLAPEGRERGTGTAP
jgi:hypothetical protein